VVDSRRTESDRTDLGDLLGELLSGICGQVQAHLVQKLRRVEVVAIQFIYQSSELLAVLQLSLN
jgi:hypothetical protein